MPDILYELYDVFPSGKGSSRRTRELLNPKNHKLEINYTLFCKYKEMKKQPPEFPFEINRIKLDMQETVNPVKEGLLYRWEFDKIDLSSYDIVHSRSPWAGVVLANKKKDHGYKYVFECNGLPSIELAYTHPKFAKSHKKEMRKLAQNETYCALEADMVIVVTHVARQYLVDRGIDPSKIHIVPNGVNSDEFTPREVPRERKIELFHNQVHPFAGDELVLGYIGAMQPWQGLISLVQGLDKLVAAFPSAKLVIAGKGRYAWRKYLRNMAKEKNVREHLIMIRETTVLKNIPELISTFDYCLAPLEHTPRNLLMGANPIKLYEYAAAGKPIIVSDLPIIREMFDEEVCYTSTPDKDSFIDEIIAIISSGCDKGELARERVKNESWKRRGKQLDKLYKSLLE